jgi:hypothetical protein
MGFEFKSDQPEQQLVDKKITLSVNGVTPKITEFTPINYPHGAKSSMYEEFGPGDDDLTQDIFAEGEEEKLAIEFLEENGLYAKFLLWCGIKEQLKNLKDSLATPTE